MERKAPSTLNRVTRFFRCGARELPTGKNEIFKINRKEFVKMTAHNAGKTEQRILWVSFGAGLIFAIIEMFMAIYTHSQSVLMDAVYDASELVIVVLTLFITPLFHKPISEKRPYGYLQVESIFVIIKGVMMLSVTLGLTINSIELALSGGNPVDGGQISFFELILGTVNIIVYIVMRRLNRVVSSPTIKSELLAWKLDIFYSIGMSVAFFGSMFLSKTPLAFISPYFDQLIAVVIVVFMLPENIKMLWRALKDVFLFSPEQSTVEEIKETCGGILSEHSFMPVFYDVTRTGRRLWVSVYFTIDGEELSIKRLKQVSGKVEAALKQRFEDCVCELIVATEEES